MLTRNQIPEARSQKPDKDSLSVCLDEISRITPSVDEAELRMILRNFPAVDVELEAHRFAERVIADGNHPTHPLRAFESWLAKARPRTKQTGDAPADRDARWRFKESQMRESLGRATHSDGQPLDWREIEIEVEGARRKFFREPVGPAMDAFEDELWNTKEAA